MRLSSKRTLKWILFGILVLLIVIQFIPIERSNPPVSVEPVWDSPATRTYAQRSCFDCHSNQTRWPFYSYVAPVSWLVASDVKEGREHLNFSEWNNSFNIEEIIEEIQEDKMPLNYYVWIHPSAKLSSQDKQKFIKGLKNTFQLSSRK